MTCHNSVCSMMQYNRAIHMNVLYMLTRVYFRTAGRPVPKSGSARGRSDHKTGEASGVRCHPTACPKRGRRVASRSMKAAGQDERANTPDATARRRCGATRSATEWHLVDGPAYGAGHLACGGQYSASRRRFASRRKSRPRAYRWCGIKSGYGRLPVLFLERVTALLAPSSQRKCLACAGLCAPDRGSDAIGYATWRARRLAYARGVLPMAVSVKMSRRPS